jgi:hypothetical protein
MLKLADFVAVHGHKYKYGSVWLHILTKNETVHKILQVTKITPFLIM